MENLYDYEKGGWQESVGFEADDLPTEVRIRWQDSFDIGSGWYTIEQINDIVTESNQMVESLGILIGYTKHFYILAGHWGKRGDQLPDLFAGVFFIPISTSLIHVVE